MPTVDFATFQKAGGKGSRACSARWVMDYPSIEIFVPLYGKGAIGGGVQLLGVQQPEVREAHPGRGSEDRRGQYALSAGEHCLLRTCRSLRCGTPTTVGFGQRPTKVDAFENSIWRAQAK